MRKIIFSILFLSISSPVLSGEYFPITGIYYDNLLGRAVEVGAFYTYERVEREMEMRDGSVEKIFDHTKFVYLEGESNGEDTNVTLGLGLHIGISSIRGGISIANIDDESLIGVEGVLTAFLFTFKAGVYRNQETQSTEGMLGVGISITGGL